MVSYCHFHHSPTNIMKDNSSPRVLQVPQRSTNNQTHTAKCSPHAWSLEVSHICRQFPFFAQTFPWVPFYGDDFPMLPQVFCGIFVKWRSLHACVCIPLLPADPPPISLECDSLLSLQPSIPLSTLSTPLSTLPTPLYKLLLLPPPMPSSNHPHRVVILPTE